MTSAVHEMWMGTFTTRDGLEGMAAALLEPMPKGALALHIPAPWGKGCATRWFETDAGVLLEAKPVAPVETTCTPRVRVVATSGGEGFGKQRLLFAKLRRIVRCFSWSWTRLNDCECTNTLAQKEQGVLCGLSL